MHNRFKSDKVNIRLNMRESTLKREAQEVLTRLGFNEHCITEVVLSVDWRYATFYCISMVDDNDEGSARFLANNSSMIGRLLKERCAGHFFPKLRFAVDKSIRQQQRIEQILMELPSESEDN